MSVRSRGFIGVLVFLVIALGGVAGVYAYDQGRADRIGKGVSIGGVDVSGLTPAAARHRLRHRFAPRLNRTVEVTWHGKRFALSGRAAHVRADLAASVDQALTRSRDGNIVTRTVRNLRGKPLDLQLQPKISYSRGAVRALVSKVGGAVDRPVREASVAFSASGPQVAEGENGLRLRRGALLASVSRGLLGRGARNVRPRVALIRPRQSTADVAKRYGTIVVVDRANFRLRLYKNLKLARTYVIAVGRQGLETPSGQYSVTDKQVNPTWHVPNSSWAGALAGKDIPPGPDDPLKARWIGITGGAGIHGTTESSSLGSAASHGCIRMAIPDVIQLFDQVPYGSTIYVA